MSKIETDQQFFVRMLWPFLTLIGSCFMLNSCVIPVPFLGGGIAGSGMDSTWKRNGAENYPDFAGSNVIVSNSAGDPNAIQGDRSKRLHRFSNHVFVSGKDATAVEGLTITYCSETIKIRKNEQLLLVEHLPAAFYYSGLQTASFKLHGETFLICTTFTRSSTGMVWVGIFRLSGEKIFAGTRPSGGVWNIRPFADGILLEGRRGRTRIHITPRTP